MINCGGTRRRVGLKPSPTDKSAGDPGYSILTAQINCAVRRGGTRRRVGLKPSAICHAKQKRTNPNASPVRNGYHAVLSPVCRKKISRILKNPIQQFAPVGVRGERRDI